jgi:outer membrane lipoprotein-sorting protein
MKWNKLLFFILLLIGLLAGGCGTGADQAATPQEILADGVAYMSGLAGFQYQLTQSGPPVYLDPEQAAQFVEAAGHYVAPDKAQTVVKISALGMVTEITVVSLGDDQWGTNPLTGSYMELDPNYLFKPVQYLDSEEGFFPKLGSGITDVSLVGEEELEELPGVPLQHLAGTIPGEVISEVSKGLIDVESLAADVWVDSSSNQIHRVVLTDLAGEDAEETPTWQFDFWSFGETIEISAP